MTRYKIISLKNVLLYTIIHHLYTMVYNGIGILSFYHEMVTNFISKSKWEDNQINTKI